MSEMTSSYELKLVLNDDKTRDTIKDLKKSLSNISVKMDKEEVNAEIGKISKTIDSIMKSTSEDSEKILKQFSKDTIDTIKSLEGEYVRLGAKRDLAQKEYNSLAEEMKKQLLLRDHTAANENERLEAVKRIGELSEKMKNTEYIKLGKQIEQNREYRRQLKSIDIFSKNAHALAKLEVKNKTITELKAKLEDAQTKNKRAYFKFIKKADTDEIKLLREKIRLLESEEKQEKKICQTVKQAVKEQEKASNIRGGRLQKAYNIAGMVGGAGRTMKAVGSAAIGVIGQGIRAASAAANHNFEREHQANRVKGMQPERANKLLGKLYVKTGSDYSTIVNAINKVQTLLSGASDDELVYAAELEMKYPGMVNGFSSSTSDANIKNFNVYANRLKAIQRETGASDEQLLASSQMFANKDISNMGNVSVTELQAIYHHIQNSGAFETPEEVDAAFNRFVRYQKNHKGDVFENASNFDWAGGIHNEINRLQADNTLKNLDWERFSGAIKTRDDSAIQKTESERLMEQTRELESKKNELVIKFLVPIATKLLDIIDSPKGKRVIDGLVKFFTEAIPVLTDVILWIKNRMDDGEDIAYNIAKFAGDVFGFANGGIATGPSIVGERAFQPEMILPLDYSRSSRAGNIIQSVSQTFNMSGNETTALSLSQAVKSREFRRATAQNAFITARGGRL